MKEEAEGSPLSPAGMVAFVLAKGARGRQEGAVWHIVEVKWTGEAWGGTC